MLASPTLSKVGSFHPENPFPDSISIHGSSADLLYAGIRIPLLIPMETETKAADLKYEVDPLFQSSGTAIRGSLVYERRRQVLVVSEDNGNTNLRTEINRWSSDAAIVAGPLAFEDALLIATDEPAFIALERKTLTLLFKRNLDVLLTGPLLPIFSSQLLCAFQADGEIAFFSLKNAEADSKTPEDIPDAVEVLLRGDAETFSRIRERTAKLLGVGDAFSFNAMYPYKARNEFEGKGATLFRLDADLDGPARFYVSGTKRPYLIAIFDSKGNELASNIEYSVAPVISNRLSLDSVYFIAVSLLGDGEETTDAVPRLVIAPK